MELSRNQINKMELDRDVARDSRRRLENKLEVLDGKIDAIKLILKCELTNEQKINAIKSIVGDV